MSVRRYLNHDNALMGLMAVITTGWIVTAAAVWRDVLRNRDATDRAAAVVVEEVRANRAETLKNRAVGLDVVARLERIERRLPPATQPATQP